MTKTKRIQQIPALSAVGADEVAIAGTDLARPHDSARAVAAAVVTLIVLGALAGAIASFLILGLDAMLGQLGHATSVRFSQLLMSMAHRISNVLVVWFQAPVDGAIMGAVTGVAISLAYVVSVWIDRGSVFFSSRTWLFVLWLGAAGAVGAALGSRGVLADVRVWAALVGALYGLAGAYVIAQSRRESRT